MLYFLPLTKLSLQSHIIYKNLDGDFKVIMEFKEIPVK